MQAVIETVRLAFPLSNIIDLKVSNNILYIAVGAATVIRIDLDDPSKVHDIQLPKKHTINRLLVDTSGSHLIVETTENQYYYCQSPQTSFKQLKLNHKINHIAWYRDQAFFTSDSTIFSLDLSSLKYDHRRSKEHAQKIWTKEPFHGIAVFHESLVALTSNGIYRSRIDPYDFELIGSVPEGSHLVVSPTDWVVVAPDAVLVGSGGGGGSETKSIPVTAADFVMLSKFNIFIFKGEELQIYNAITLKLVETLAVPHITGVASDLTFSTFWMFNSTAVFELKLEKEKEGMWAIYLSQNQFEKALELASARDKPLIYREYGESEYEKGKLLESARYYGLSDAHLEGLALKFTGEPLIQLLKSRLGITVNSVQQTILTSWIGELMLQNGLNTQFKEFVTNCKAQISTTVYFSLLQNHGAMELLLWFADFVQDYKAVITHYIEQSQWELALQVLREHEDEALIYRYSNVLLSHAPQATVESWMRIPKLDPLRLLPALLSYSSTYKGDFRGHQAIRYLKYQLQSDKVTAPLYNAILMIYSQTDNEDELLAFLTAKASKFPDYNFGLRVCLENKKIKCAIYLYTVMNLYEEAVSLCLDQNLISQAVEIVEQRVDNEQLRRSLWLEIAKKLINENNHETKIKLTDHLNVEDILELFPDFDTLDHMVPEVVKALEASSNSLVAIHQEMQDSIRASKGMQHEMKSFRKQYALVEPGEPCQHCSFPLATRKFYVFPCQHGFHFDCIVKDLELGSKQGQIARLRAEFSDAKELNDALDPLAKEECLLCSETRIDEVDKLVEEEW